jgi:hypothetical protein
LLVLPLLDGDVLLLLPEPELPVEPDLPEVVDDPEAPMAPVEPEPEPEPPDCADDPELPDEPLLAESEPPLPQAASETAAEATMARMALRERVDACMRVFLSSDAGGHGP